MNDPRADEPTASERMLEGSTSISPNQALNELSRMNNQLVTLQRELARANARLRLVTEEKDRVLGMVVHDLRNPLAILAVNLDLLRADERVQADAETAEALADMHTSAESMKTMLGDLLDITAINAGRLDLRRARVALSTLVGASVRRNGLLAARKGTIIRYSDERGNVNAPFHVDVDVDARRLGQVLDNIIGNAVKYSPPGTQVDVVMRATADGVATEVRDRGPGIAPAELSKLFTPFGKTGAQPTGGESSVGLGLAIAKRIVEAHGGRIEVDSELGQGSTFRVVLKAL
ncbi:MAG: signal transduction histidine kinase [Myxococcaceae bacterium]|nr:signal transduction histidine kinase [Myxococcaceae bacterium]